MWLRARGHFAHQPPPSVGTADAEINSHSAASECRFLRPQYLPDLSWAFFIEPGLN